jgi:hypothetical protein
MRGGCSVVAAAGGWCVLPMQADAWGNETALGGAGRKTSRARVGLLVPERKPSCRQVAIYGLA